MFTRKLYQAGIAGLSLFFIAATPGVHFLRGHGDTNSSLQKLKDHDSTCKNGHSFDSSGLCSCLENVPVDDLALAPRIRLNKHVAGFVHDYIKKDGYFLAKIKPRSVPYFDIIDSIFQVNDLPVELKYLAFIESRLNSQSGTLTRAAGLWEFMPVAAKRFDLKVSRQNDERKNVYKSTVAAAKCLTYLHGMFDDWLLTLAAYNCGPGHVLSAIKRSGSRDFWTLQSFLPEETRKHVRKFIAVHYYFEGHGSLTTLTKKETNAHIDAVAAFVKKYEQRTDSSLAKTTVVTL